MLDRKHTLGQANPIGHAEERAGHTSDTPNFSDLKSTCRCLYCLCNRPCNKHGSHPDPVYYDTKLSTLTINIEPLNLPRGVHAPGKSNIANAFPCLESPTSTHRPQELTHGNRHASHQPLIEQKNNKNRMNATIHDTHKHTN